MTEPWNSAQGLAWTPDGKEIWFSAGGETGENGSRYQLWAVVPGGTSRLVYGPPADLWLHDISSTGAVLFAREDSRGELGGLLKGDTKERNLSTWSDEAAAGISADGSIFAGIEQAAPGAGLEPFLYYRRAGETAPVRLGVGMAAGISPDGRWVASRTDSVRSGVALTLLPTGPGDPRPLPLGSVRPAATPSRISARWSVDGRLMLFSGSEKGRLSRAWLLTSPERIPARRHPRRMRCRGPFARRRIGRDRGHRWKAASLFPWWRADGDSGSASGRDSTRVGGFRESALPLGSNVAGSNRPPRACERAPVGLEGACARPDRSPLRECDPDARRTALRLPRSPRALRAHCRRGPRVKGA